MSNISPKLIDIEGNRIETDDMTGRNKYDRKVEIGAFADRKNIKYIGSFDDKWKGGRFPTQLFTNITDDKYKYVKRI